ncbi:methylenetetrahydrofolate reductase [Prochlorococcus sp. MIT 1307]|uniref:methylenetetrahydrofolate reductase n=1 Tax=Prochlorococcus sp. MIT 1307 TaxID=3096219 RepID=UPI002A76527C|nr:methylenetetrahydrofolate reductase [Prochlorococcus sp. MIT 1307]
MRSVLERSLSSEGVTITAEIMPPRGADPSRAIQKAQKLAKHVHALNVTDGSRAVMRMSSLALCKLLLDIGLDPVLQIACRDRNRIALQADLLGANALGIKNVLCLTGDPVRVGDQPDTKQVSEFNSIGLLKQVTSLNKGEDPVSGELADGPTSLFPGAAADPNCPSFNSLRRRLEQKRDAGARFLQTQMVMDPKVLENFCNEVANPLELPVLAGVFLLKSAKNALFINRVVPGACIPNSIVNRLEQSTDPANEGIAIAAEQVQRFLGLAKGVHVMAIKAEERVAEILERAGVSSLQQ